MSKESDKVCDLIKKQSELKAFREVLTRISVVEQVGGLTLKQYLKKRISGLKKELEK